MREVTCTQYQELLNTSMHLPQSGNQLLQGTFPLPSSWADQAQLPHPAQSSSSVVHRTQTEGERFASGPAVALPQVCPPTQSQLPIWLFHL